MEDTKSLLVMVLQKIFQNRPKVVEDTFQLIYNYNNGKREKNEYEKTLKSICELMNNELPSQILVYLLTLVDMPKEDGLNQLPIMEKMQKTHNCLPESVRPHLLEYLRSKKISNVKEICDNTIRSQESYNPESVMENIEKCDSFDENISSDLSSKESSQNTDEDYFIKPAKRPRIKKKFGKNIQCESSDENLEPVKSLLDIVANYVVKNEAKLKLYYKKKQEKAWNMINSNIYNGRKLRQCYAVVKDLNKKTKLLRMIENDNITEDIYFEEYKNSEIFFKEKHMLHILNKDPFAVIPKLMQDINMYLNSL